MHSEKASPTGQQRQSMLRIPAPVKRVFDQFPLVTYDENELPSRAPRKDGRVENVLHVFTTAADVRTGRPSYNPGCLRWQAYLRFASISFRTVPSSNHASPSGILPFLLPATAGDASVAADAVPSNKLKKWAASKGAQDVAEPEDIRYEAYTSLLENAVRKAWLYQLYLSPTNADLLHKLYIEPCSSQPFVQMSIKHNLRQAAENELAKTSYSASISEEEIVRDVERAFEALSSLLGNDDWFFTQKAPTMLDASLFAYSHLLLDDGMNWVHNPLADMLKQHQNLVDHRHKILRSYF